jgi:beta-N-acetylhexosaminidase
MELETLIGARLAVGIPGLEATDEVVAALQATRAQSLVVFSRNFASPAQFTRLLRDLEERLQRWLLVLVDHEGGRIIRFASGVTRFPDAATVGRTQAPADVERQGRVEAQELRGLGVHANLAPCVDVVGEGSDPIIGDRSYGAEPSHVGALGAARIRGLQAHGVAACAKHFPGLGAVPRDPHKVLPTISLGWPQMRRTHLPPFQAAIEAGVAMIMSSHVCYPGLGEPAGLPATFSPRLIREQLRAQMRYEGLILTDDLEMGALRAFGSMGEAAIRATEAGHDLLLICSDLAAAKEALSSLGTAYATGRLSVAELELSAARVEQMRRKFLPSSLE